MELRDHRTGSARAKAAGVFGVAAALCFAPTAAYAQEPVPTTPAPPGSASAAVLTVGDVVKISETQAEANQSSGRARAGVVYLNNNPVLGTGGTQEGAGSKNGALLDTGATPLGRVQVAPWEVAVTESQNERTARGRAAALDLYVVNKDLVHVVLLESKSEAKHSNGKSSGSASSDAARVRALGGAVDVTVLHAETSSENGSKSYLVKVNGTEIGSDKQVGSICNLAVPSVVTAGCLKATGGTGADGVTTGGASVVTADVVPLPLDTTVVGASSSSGTAQAPAGQSTENREEVDEREEAEEAAAPSAPRTETQDGALPNTGSTAAALGGIAAVAVAAGAWLQSVGILRRREVGELA